MAVAVPLYDPATSTPPPQSWPPFRLAAMKFPLLPQAVESMALGVIISDATRPDNPVVYCNPGFERLTGYTCAETVGRNCRFLQGPDTDPRELAKLRHALRTRTGCSVVLQNYRKDRRSFWNALTITPLTDPEGRVTHFVGVQTDISHAKQLEAQLLQAQKMELVGRLTGGVAHDFNNLLTVITGFTEAALDLVPHDGPARPMLREVIAAGERAAGLTRQLLAFSRKTGAKGASADLSAVVSGCAGMLRQLLGRGIELTIEPGSRLRPVAADPGYLEQVLLNLAVNARDAMPAGGRLTVATEPVVVGAGDPGHPGLAPGEYGLLRVADTGHGMDAATRARIFEPFFTTKPAGRGTGLGLATVTDIVRASGGHLRVESEPGRGATFFVYLPQTARAAEPAPTMSEEYRLRGAEVVLVADDDDAVRAVMGLALRSRGYTVLEAGSVPEALALARDHPGAIDLAISDALMPGAGTDEFFRALRALKPGLKLLSVSGYWPEEDAPEGAAGHFLAKPFSPLALGLKVRQVLDGR